MTAAIIVAGALIAVSISVLAFAVFRVAVAITELAFSVATGDEPRPSPATPFPLLGTPEPGLYRATEDDLEAAEELRQRILHDDYYEDDS